MVCSTCASGGSGGCATGSPEIAAAFVSGAAGLASTAAFESEAASDSECFADCAVAVEKIIIGTVAERHDNKRSFGKEEECLEIMN
jgi:hypothetical protein